MPLMSQEDYQAECSQFLIDFARAIQLAQMYEENNQNLVDPIEAVRARLFKLQEGRGTFQIHERESVVFVNGERLHCDGATFLRHMQFFRLLAKRKIAGLVFQRPLGEPEWRAFLQAVSRYDRASQTPFEDISAAVAAKGLAHVSLLQLQEGAPVTRLANIRVERRVFAVRTVAKAMVLLKKFVENLVRPGAHRFYPMKLHRVLQDLLTVCLEDGWKYVGVVNNKPGDEYLYEHGVTVALSSIVTGIHLGLKRGRLTELGMAALTHDLGKALQPGDLMERKDKLTNEERERIRKSAVYGVRALLKEKQYDEALLKRILVLCDLQAQEKTSAHAYSRLIAVAERFDALTSPRPYRAALLPDHAIGMLLTLRGLDKGYVQAFIRAMGLYPPGTVLELSTGDLAVSFHPHPDPKMYAQPIARIARYADGKEALGSPVVDLAGEGITVKRSLDPAAAGMHVSVILARASNEAKT